MNSNSHKTKQQIPQLPGVEQALDQNMQWQQRDSEQNNVQQQDRRVPQIEVQNEMKSIDLNDVRPASGEIKSGKLDINKVQSLPSPNGISPTDSRDLQNRSLSPNSGTDKDQHMQQFNNQIIIDTNADEAASIGQKNEDTILADSLSRDENERSPLRRQQLDDQKANDKNQTKQQGASDLQIYNDFKDFPHTKWNPQENTLGCPQSSYWDARGLENSEVMDLMVKKNQEGRPVLFDLQNTWLKGEQYAHILQNQDRYCQVFGARKYDQKQHPESIYIDPQDGLLYFVEGATIGSDFGFPRLGIRKRFKWKKMNFTTDLPKKDPLVSYIVASAVKCEKFFPGSNDDGPVYRMHAVILKKSDPKLQLAPLTPRGQGNNSQMIAQQLGSQDNSTNQDMSNQKQQTRSLHGRVITKSQKLKQSGYNAKNESPASVVGAPQVPQQVQKCEKNYILCHVRRVICKKEDEEMIGVVGDNSSPVTPIDQSQRVHISHKSKIPNKQNLPITPQSSTPLNIQQQESSVNQSGLKIDMKQVKKMSILELEAAGLVSVDAEGKSVKLSTYKMRKMLEQQAQQKLDSQKQSEELRKQNNSVVICKENSTGTAAQKSDPRKKPVTSEQMIKQMARKHSSVSSEQESRPTGNQGSKKPILINPQLGGNNGNSGVGQNKSQLSDLQVLANQQNLQQLFNGGNGEVSNTNGGEQLNSQLQALTNLQNQYNVGLAQLNAGNLGNLGGFGPNNGNNISQLQAAQYNQALTAQLTAQNQLIGLGNIGALNGLNNLALAGLGIGNLGNLGALQGLGNLNNIGIINSLNPLANLQNLQAGLLGQMNNGQNNNLMGQQQNIQNGGNGHDSNAKASNETNNTARKRDQKVLRKYEAQKVGDGSNSLNMNPFKDPSISPSLLPLGNIGSLISGQNPGGVIVGNNKQRKLTSDQSLSPWAGIADSLVKECTKEITRRLSGQNQNDEKQIDWGDNKSSNFLNNVSSFIPGNDRLKRKISTNSHIGRDRLNSAFRQYDAKSTNNVVEKSPLVRGNQGEPSFGPGSRATSNANQGGSGGAITNRKSDEQEAIDVEAAGRGPESKVEDSNQLMQQMSNMGAGNSNTENLTSGANGSAIQQNQQQSGSQNFQTNLQSAIMSNSQFFLTNPNFESENTGNLNQSSTAPKQKSNIGNSQLTEEGGETDQLQQNSVVAAAQQLQMYQQQQLLQTQQQLNYLNNLQQLHMAGQTAGNQQLGQLNQLNQLCAGNGLNPGNVQELLQYQQLVQQQQMQDKDSKNGLKQEPQQISQQINIIQHQKISPVLQGGIFLNQSFGSGAKVNQMSNNHVKSQNANNNNRQRQLSVQASPNTITPHMGHPNGQKSSSFLNQIKNALAADRGSCLPHDNKKDPSFTIHVPNGQSHRESYFGSFGRKSGEGFGLGGKRESNDQKETHKYSHNLMSVPNQGGQGHPLSICNAILSSINQTKGATRTNNNMVKDPSPVSLNPDKDDTQQNESGTSFDKKMEDLAGPNSIKTPGQLLRGQQGVTNASDRNLLMPAHLKQGSNNRQMNLANFGNSMDNGTDSQFTGTMNNLSNSGTFYMGRQNQNQNK